MTMVETETLLDRRAQVAEEISKTIAQLGTLLSEELQLRDQLRRALERDGLSTIVFETAVSIQDAICGELTKAGLHPHRADPRLRLTSLVRDQNSRFRNQAAVRAQAAGKSAA
jgi:hypothetical protein